MFRSILPDMPTRMRPRPAFGPAGGISIRASTLILAALAVSGTAAAHHGFGSFDMESQVEITGVVTDLAFVNPHSWLYLDVTGSDGETVAMRCEMRSATTLRRSGWSPDMFVTGSTVTIEGSPDRNDPNACYVSTVVFDDGSTIDRYGQRTPPTPAASTERALRLANGDPDISGEWAAEQLVMSDPRGVGGALVPLAEAEARGDSERTAAGEGRGRVPLISAEAASRLFVGAVELTPAGAAAQAAREGANPARSCAPISIVVDWSYDAPVNRITQNEQTIVLEYGKFDYSRTIHLNQDRHPDALEPGLTGHSIGRWDEDVLVVDTIGIRPGPLTRSLFHSETLRLVERWALDTETMALTREFTAEDPLYFAEPFTGTDVVYPSNVPFQPSPCDDRSLF